ncbi:hypothetical protein HV127_22630 [Klebsiella sp. RHBSTW-00215]|uniref:hypothetical protein n=1 Tax=Klebsiella sp. RHBSTW-00215 TaxID=2742640 RepID=UPI0015F393F5|nr:hypothetical protein [Klebsiella sp. RHBSTW-00215]MBA7934016.1 hypothetical protein [Klebsiella sp. RHBSTW-00215]
MTFYLTGNPVPSESVLDIRDNSKNLDLALNDITSALWTDRLGRNRMSWFGMESAFTVKLTDFEARFVAQLGKQQLVFEEALVDKESRFQQFLLSSGYVFLGDYEGGPFQFSARNQYIRYDNQYYRLNAATGVGFTTTGTNATSFTNDVTHFVLMDGDTLRQNLGSGEGDPIVAPEKVRLVTADDDSDFPLDAALADVLSNVNPRMWKDYVVKGATKDEDDWSEAIQKAINYAHKKNKKFVNNESYGISKSIELPFPITIEFLNKCGSWYALPGFVGDMVKSKGAPEGDYMSLISPTSESNGIFIRNMTLFGGWVSDELTPSYTGVRDGLRLFGVQHDLDNIKVMNVRGKTYNLGGRSNTSIKGMAPSDYSRLRADWCGEEAFIFGGSSDSHADRIKVRDASQLASGVYPAIRVGQNGTLRADKFHVWNSSTAKRHDCCIEVLAYDSIFMNCHFEGAANTQIRVIGGRNQFIGFEVYNQWTSGGAMIEVLNNSTKLSGRAYIHSLILPDISVYAVRLGNADNQVAFTNVDIEVYNTKLGVFKIENHIGYLSGKVVGDTTNYTSDQNRALVVAGNLIDGKDSIIFDTPQYRSFIGGGSVNIAKGMNAAGDINTQGNVYSESAIFRNLPTVAPYAKGAIYVDPVTGSLKAKLNNG